MKNKFYFLNNQSAIAYDKAYFDIYMRDNNIKEIKVLKATPEIVGGGVFWCSKLVLVGDSTQNTCGRNNCQFYIPRNKINGVCKYHFHWLYDKGDEVILKL